MQNGGGNIYQTARKSAGLTQEAAAERLAVSLTSLRAYEGGERVPAGDVVARMCLVYDTQFLGVQHLQAFGALLPECGWRRLPSSWCVGSCALPRATGTTGCWRLPRTA